MNQTKRPVQTSIQILVGIIFTLSLMFLIGSSPLNIATVAAQDAPTALTAPNPNNPPDGFIRYTPRPQLNWSSVPTATGYDIQVDNNSNFSSPERQASTGCGSCVNWTINPDLTTGTWYWRVRAKNASETGPWSITRSFIIQNPLAPNLNSPADGFIRYTPRPQLNWSSITDATGYQIQVDNNSNFSSPERQASTGCGSCVNWTINPDLTTGTWYWRVRAVSSSLTGAWSTSRSFIIQNPLAPNLNNPADGFIRYTPRPQLNWNSVTDATGYEIQVDNNSNFSSPERQASTGCGSCVNWTINPDLTTGTWYWRVRAVSSSLTGAWSTSRSFIIQNPLVPNQNNPANGAVFTTLSPQLSWSSVTDATGYQIQIDNAADFSSPDRTGSTGCGSCLNWTTNPALTAGRWYWRVRAVSSSLTGPWSAPRTFTIGTSASLQSGLALFNMSTGNASLLTTLDNNPAPSAYQNYTPGAPIAGTWVMGDWDGNGTDTPGVFANGAFHKTNDQNVSNNWSAHWIGPNGIPVAGRFNPSLMNDCFGVIEQATLGGFTVFVLYYTCDFSTTTPTIQWHWVSAVLYDTASLPGLSGAWQFAVGDFNNNGSDTIAARRGPYVAWSNVPIVDSGNPNTGAEFAFAQYFGLPIAGGDYGVFVSGDWNGNNVNGFGIFYGSANRLYYSNSTAWEVGTLNTQNITNYLGAPRNLVTWRPNWGNNLVAESDLDQPLQSLGLEAPIQLELLPLESFPEENELSPLD